MNFKNNNKNNFYSFNKQDLVILLSVYNAVFVASTSIIKGHSIICFLTAVLLSLIALFVIVWIDFARKTDEEETELEHEQKAVRRKIRDEYLKVHNINRKHELLIKAGCFPKEQRERNLVIDHDDPQLSLNKHFGEVKEVHFNYVDNMILSEKIRGQPEGT